MNQPAYLIKREIPYIKSSEILKLEKRIDAYIASNPLRLDIEIYPQLFKVFLKGIPKDKQNRYEANGIPYGKDGIYTLKLKDNNK